MTTDEDQRLDDQKRSPRPDDEDDLFSSENYTIDRTEPDESETVILGMVPGEAIDRKAVVNLPLARSVEQSEADDDDEDGSGSEAGNLDSTESTESTEHANDAAETDPVDRSEQPAPTDQSEQSAPFEQSAPSEQSEQPTESDDNESDRETSTESDEPVDRRPPEVSPDDYIEMRQVAGLTAGSMMKLTVGRAFEFNESNDGGSFSLRVLENGEVVLHPGSARSVIDEIEVNEPMLVGDALLNVSSACFSVRRPRQPATSQSRLESIEATFASVSAIHVPPLGAEEPLTPEQLMGSRLGTLLNRSPLTRGAVGQNAWSFLQSVREARSVVAERHRLMHPDPEELKTRLSRLDPGLWERGRDHSLFGRFGIGYANIPWEPKFDNPELIPEFLHESIVEMSLLPWVPVTANLLYGPLGIVGKRAARLAACRHAILSLAALSMPGEARFAIRSGKNTATSWYWTRALPPMMSAESDSPYVVTVIDGADGVLPDSAIHEAGNEADASSETEDESPSDHDEATDTDLAIDASRTAEIPVVDIGGDDLDALASVTTHAPGTIMLAGSLEELGQPCGTVLQIEPDGTGSVTNHLNETIQVTPIGVTEAFAHDMATRIADILTDSFL